MFSEIIELGASTFVSRDNTGVYVLYTDPGTGALAWQLLLASIVGGLFYARSLLDKLKVLTSRKNKSLNNK